MVVVSKDKILSTDDKVSTSKNSFTIHSGKKTGTVTLYIKDNRSDVSSNKIKVKVEDKAAIKKAKEEEKKKEGRSCGYRITRRNGIGSKYRI